MHCCSSLHLALYEVVLSRDNPQIVLLAKPARCPRCRGTGIILTSAAEGAEFRGDFASAGTVAIIGAGGVVRRSPLRCNSEGSASPCMNATRHSICVNKGTV